MYLRVSLLDRCNLRCTYCLPENVRFAKHDCSSTELMELMRHICNCLNINKIRLTGGEPTLHPDLIQFVTFSKQLVPCVGLTSNGILLEDKLPALKDAGLDLLNISIDAIDEAGFHKFSRRNGLNKVIDSIHAAKALNFDPLKINAVAHQDSDFGALLNFAQYEGLHLRFIELMRIGVAREQVEQYISSADIRERLFAEGFSLWEHSDLDLPTSRVWCINGISPEHCTLGFITTSSAPFCGSCDRLRLDSRGRLFNCLFDESGIDLLKHLRNGDEKALNDSILRSVHEKEPPEQFERLQEMALIGG